MRTRWMVAAALIAVPVAAQAHHGWSSYDAEKTMTVKAPLSAVTWGNPHGAAKVEWQKRTWDVVLAPVARMEARGLTREMLAPKKAVTLVGYPRRDGTPEMRIERVIVDGKTVELR
ncbi:DUF6152 family protein [Sphingomonas sanxanigenens]|nr:DUF6152 family protein [Sphingomonas sanxanigenens]